MAIARKVVVCPSCHGKRKFITSCHLCNDTGYTGEAMSQRRKTSMGRVAHNGKAILPQSEDICYLDSLTSS